MIKELKLFFVFLFVLTGTALTVVKTNPSAALTSLVNGKPESLKTESTKPMEAINDYTTVPGILTFRGSALRQNAAYGTATVNKRALKLIWKQSLPSTGSIWGGGAGWTGQPLLVQWPQNVKTFMKLTTAQKSDAHFVEVIQASLNGKVYFFDLKTGKTTRTPINIGNPIKGTPSIDNRGYPILYVGDGIDSNGKAGFRLFNLITQKEMLYQPSKDAASPRIWPGMDSSALFEGDKDQMTTGAENGLIYQIKLNTTFNIETGKLNIQPVKKYFAAKKPAKVKEGKLSKEGTENSLASYGNYYFYSNNGGLLRCITHDLKPVWTLDNKDDTDATVTVDLENDKPMLYTGNEVDWQGEKGMSTLLKVDGQTGKILWKKNYICYSKFGSSPSNGGALATNIVGKGDMSHLVIFTLSRCDGINRGAVVALDKKTGKTVWRVNLNTYAWSSPLAIYDAKGKSYILQNDRSGYTHLFEGTTGKEVFKKKTDSYLEASPAAFENKIVFTSRTGYLYCYEIY